MLHIFIYTFTLYIFEEQPTVTTRCFMGFTQSSDDYTVLFYL